MTKRSQFEYFKTSPKIIRLAKILHVRVPFSLRNVADPLYERAVDISRETVRVIETAKMNDLDPRAYLADLLDRIHDHMANRLDEMLPWNWTPQDQQKKAA